MKKLFAVFITVLLLLSLTAGLLPALALEEKKDEAPERPELRSEEVIYAVMSGNGSVKGMYSVCLIDSQKEHEASYFGPFKTVENLSDTQEIKLEGDEVSMKVPKGKFYFKSFLDTKELPWIFDIGYKLDGDYISAKDLGGKTGLLEINLKSKPNEKIDESFRNSFVMQIGISLKAEKTGNIEAEGITVANAGGTKLLTIFGLPGKDLDATVKAEVEDFEMQGISIAAVPFSLADQLGEVKGLSDGLVQLANAVGALNAGAGQLAGGFDQLKEGSSKFGEGLMLLSQNSETLRQGSGQVMTAINNMNEMLSKFSALAENFNVNALAFLPASLNAIADGLDAAADNLAAIPDKINAATATLTEAIAQLGAVDEVGIAELIAKNPDDAALMQLIANYRAARALAEIWQTTMGEFQLTGNVVAPCVASMRQQAQNARGLAASVSAVIAEASIGGLGDLTSGLSQFASGYAQLHNGIVQYTQGVDTLAASWGQIYGGMNQLSDGANKLSGGLGMLNAGTAGIPRRIKELMGNLNLGEYEPVSYLSEKNENCELVQFVIMTDPIEAHAKEKPEPEPEAETSFLDRIKALFVPDKGAPELSPAPSSEPASEASSVKDEKVPAESSAPKDGKRK